MQPDPTTPALTAARDALLAEFNRAAFTSEGSYLNVLFASRLDAFIALVAQQPDERVAGLVEALRASNGKVAFLLAVIRSGEALSDAEEAEVRERIATNRRLLAQPTAAGGAASRSGISLSPAAGGAAGEPCREPRCRLVGMSGARHPAHEMLPPTTPSDAPDAMP
jgi:hypothetical protein